MNTLAGLHGEREPGGIKLRIKLGVVGGDKRTKQEGQRSRRRCDHRYRGQREVRKGLRAQECKQPLDLEQAGHGFPP